MAETPAFIAGLETAIVATFKLIGSAVRHPNTAQTMTIENGHVEVVPDDRGGSLT
jgi:hypothetical protein